MGADNNGTTATLKIQSGSRAMLLDGNEIDVASNNNIAIQGNSSGNVFLGTGGGKVGIGTGLPSQKLDVAGNVRVRQTLFVNGVINSASQNFKIRRGSIRPENTCSSVNAHAMCALSTNSFGHTFSSPPIVIVSLDVDGANAFVAQHRLIVTTHNISTTHFGWNVANNHSAAITLTGMDLNWIAIGD